MLADTLLREHALTRRMLTSLERIAARLEVGMPFPAHDTARILSFCREFLERVHHVKEGSVCFPAATMFGDDEVAETVGRLTGEQEESRDLLYALTLCWEPDELRDAERDTFAELARTYVQRMGRHMELEERTIIPALLRIPADEQLALLEACELHDGDPGSFDAWAAEADRLERDHPV